MITIAQFIAALAAQGITRSHSTIRRLCVSGTLGAAKVGRDWFIAKGEVDRYVNEVKYTLGGE